MASIIEYCHEGFGRHTIYIEPTKLPLINKYIHIAILFNTVSALFARISICFLLMTLFGVDKRWRRGLYVTIGFLVVSSIPLIIVVLAQCQPLRKLWYPQTPGRCWDPSIEVKTSYYQGSRHWSLVVENRSWFDANEDKAISAICDFTLSTLPIFCLWNIQIRMRAKIGICMLMGMGFL